MESNDFSEIQMAVFSFFETKMKKSNLFQAKAKVDKKKKELEQNKGKEIAVKEEQLRELKINLKKQREASLGDEIPNWLTECADKAQSVDKPMFKVTHPTKFSHGLVPFGGIYVKPVLKFSKQYLTTETLRLADFDITNSNGNLISHGRFLMQRLDNETVYEKLEKLDTAWLFEFSKNESQVKYWEEGLSLWVGKPRLTDLSRMKQNYFYMPDGTYHLTSPLFSSSICQMIYDKVRLKKFGQDNRKLRNAKNKKRHAEGVLVEFPNIAIMNFGGAQPQNITVGNFERNGEAFLLSCSPPIWKSTLKPPLNTRSIFDDEYDRRAWKTAKELQSFLVKLHKKKSNMDIRKQVKQLVYQLIDTLLDYVSEIHNLKEQVGWSENADELKQSHKLWLDPYRQDKEFQDQRTSGEWQTEVCKDFGVWLNKKLEHKKMLFGKIESKHWAKLLKNQLREFERDMELPV